MSETTGVPDGPLYLDKAVSDLYAALSGVSTQIVEAAGEAGISDQLLGLVNLRVSPINGTGYCLYVNYAKAVRIGEHPRRLAVLEEWRDNQLFDDTESAALELAESITRIPAPSVREETEDAARR